MQSALVRLVAAGWISLVVAGCASSRTVDLISTPAGAMARVGEGECEAPCSLEAGPADETALYTWSDGRMVTVPIPRPPGHFDRVLYYTGQSVSFICRLVGAPLTIGGGVSMYILANSNDMETHQQREEQADWWVGSLVAFGVGASLWVAADAIEEGLGKSPGEPVSLRAVAPRPTKRQPAEKIEFDLEKLDGDGLRGPPDGKVALSYEFAIPDTSAAKAEVQAIDPTVKFMPGSAGRVGAGARQCLCVGETGQPHYREVLRALTELPYIQRIIECDYE